MENKITVLIADDHPAVRYGVRSILQLEENIQVTGEASNGDEVLEILARQPVNIVLLDINMPGKDGVETTRSIRKLYPQVMILIFSIFDDEYKVVKMIKAGANGYVLKAADINELVKAINSVMNGERYISKEIADKVIYDVVAGNMPDSSEEPEVPYSLSRREEEILSMLANDNSYSEIATKLHISKRTVDTHRYNISKKLGIKSLAGLIRYAINHNLA